MKRSLMITVGLMMLALVQSIQSGVITAQSPEAIARTTLDGMELELYAVVKKSFGSDGREPMMRFMLSDQLQESKVNFGPWEKSRGTRLNKDEYVLGFLLRNRQGAIPAADVRLATAFRATSGGAVESYWPSGLSDNPLSEFSAYKWDYRLAPLVLAVPKGSQTIDKLEGALIVAPQDRTVITLSQRGRR